MAVATRDLHTSNRSAAQRGISRAPRLLGTLVRHLADVLEVCQLSVAQDGLPDEGSNRTTDIGMRANAGNWRVMLFFCVAARLWKHDARGRAMHTQHEHSCCKFSIKMCVVCKNLIFAFKDRILGQPLEVRAFIENLQQKCSCCVLC